MSQRNRKRPARRIPRSARAVRFVPSSIMLAPAPTPPPVPSTPPGQLGRLQGAIAAQVGVSDRVRLITERLQSLI